MKRVFTIVCGVFLAAFSSLEYEARATSTATPESTALNTILLEMRLFANNTGRPPTNWAELGQYVDLNKINRQIPPNSPAYPLQEHYVFVADKIPVPGFELGNVVLIRTGSVTNSDGDEEREGRFIISRNEGVLKFTWLAETNVQQMLADAGIKELPKPEPWPPPSTNTVEAAPPSPDLSPRPTIPNSPSARHPESTPSPVPELTHTTPVAGPVEAEAPVANGPMANSWLIVGAVGLVSVVLALVFLRRKA